MARELVRLAREQGLSLTGPDGLLKQFTKTVLETALNEEMTEHFGHEKHQADPGRFASNVRNGTRPKTVLTEATGQVTIEVPRDRDGSFEPVIVKKRQRRLNGVDEIVLSLYTNGLTTGEIGAHFAQVYGPSVSKETISRITDWTRRYLIPTESPDYAKWKAKPGTHQGSTVSMKRPEGKDADNPNAGGLKHEQYYPWGGDDWRAANGMRNGVESVNRNLKRSQYEDIADAEKRAVRGNTFSYLVIALATVVENMRKIVSFYKEQLKLTTLNPKNNRLPGSYWQSTKQATEANDASDPPG